MGEEPDSRTEKPKEATVTEEGVFQDAKLALVTAPNRCDLVLQPGEILSVGEPQLPVIGVANEVMSPFVELGKRLLNLETFPAITRVAFGSVLLLPVSDRVKGYEQLNPYLPFKLDATNSSDFSYRINRPRDSRSGVASLRINRLCKWSTLAFRSGEFMAAGPEVVTRENETVYACRVELDINTDPGFSGDIPKDILDELVDLAREICEKGDKP